MGDYTVIGKRVPKIDAVPIVTGSAQYTGDMVLPAMLHGRFLRSPYSHAKIIYIDTSRAEKLRGVKAIITGKDPSNQKWGYVLDPTQMDEYPLAKSKVLYIGDEVAAVAAIDEDIAQEAVDLIQVEYEELPAVFDIESAMQPDAPQLHEGTNNNIGLHFPINAGNVEDGFKDSDYIREDRFIINPLHTCYPEPLVCIADFSSGSKLTLWTPTQSSYFFQKMLAAVLGMEESDIRIIKPFMGGGNCGKLEALAHHFCAAMLSKKTGRPVKIERSREECFTLNRGSGKAVIELKTGVKKNGTFIAKQCKYMGDMGAYKALGGDITLAGIFLDIPYRVPNLKYDGYSIYTNNAPMPGAQRGSGITTIHAADESHIDMLAEDIGIDPAEIRLKNALRVGETSILGFPIKSCGLSECIQKVKELVSWEEKRKNLPKYRGIGIACGGHPSGGSKARAPHNVSSVLIKVDEGGGVTLITGAMELGQGLHTILAQIAAEEIGVGVNDVKIVSGDTEVTPVDIGSWGSRGTISTGNAVKAAAAEAKKQLLSAAAMRLGVKGEDLIARDGRIYLKEDDTRGLSIAEVARFSTCEGRPILVKGSFNPKTDILDPVISVMEGKYTSISYSFTAEVAEVEVDPETGKVTVLRFTAAHDCGFALNPMAVEGQIQGQISHGVGQALLERRILDKGRMLNPDFLEYKTPTALDMPETKEIIVETNDPYGPFGAKECGEGPTVPVVPAIAAAVAHATGVRIKEFPVSPEELLEQLKSFRKV